MIHPQEMLRWEQGQRVRKKLHRMACAARMMKKETYLYPFAGGKKKFAITLVPRVRTVSLPLLLARFPLPALSPPQPHSSLDSFPTLHILCSSGLIAPHPRT